MKRTLNRRDVIGAGLAAAGLACWPARIALAQGAVGSRIIPSSGEPVPAVGLGTWITFNVGDDPVLRAECADVMAAFFEAGGRLIDSSPMYGSSQSVVGHGLNLLGMPKGLFAADKVWTSSADEGPEQIERSRSAWTVPRFDLLQVHNLVAHDHHLGLLFDMKAAGLVRYVGITTSEGRRHDLFEEIMRRHPLDFVQVTYNPVDREVEERILPLARERGVGVIVNRPFRQGALTRRLEREPVPAMAADLGVATWAGLILKFILAHPAVTVAIPATTRADHARENVLASMDPMPDADERERISALILNL